MKKYAKIISQQTKQCEVGIGTNDKYYKSLGMTLQDVEQGKDNNWYLVGYAPKQTEEERLKEEAKTLESQTGYTRVLREIILKTDVSKEAKAVAEKIERVAIKLRK